MWYLLTHRSLPWGSTNRRSQNWTQLDRHTTNRSCLPRLSPRTPGEPPPCLLWEEFQASRNLLVYWKLHSVDWAEYSDKTENNLGDPARSVHVILTRREECEPLAGVFLQICAVWTWDSQQPRTTRYKTPDKIWRRNGRYENIYVIIYQAVKNSH